MSAYLPPTNWTQTIFNPENWIQYDTSLTIAMANKKYIIKTGSDTAVGSITLLNQITASYFSASSAGDATNGAFKLSSGYGMYLTGGNTINFSAGGSSKLTIAAGKVAATVAISAQNGSASNCSFQSTSNTGTGVYVSGTTAGMSSNGNSIFVSTSSYMSMGMPIKGVNGSSVSCSYQFTAEQGMGLFYVSANVMGISIGGTKQLEVVNTGIKFTNSGVSGATPSELNYYEALASDVSTYWFFDTETDTRSFRLTRVGRVVTFQLVDRLQLTAPANPSGTITSTGGIIPTRFRPAVDVDTACVVRVLENGTTNQWWNVAVSSSGTITINRYSGTTIYGIEVNKFTCTWTTSIY
jgi:hypothetical protein